MHVVVRAGHQLFTSKLGLPFAQRRPPHTQVFRHLCDCPIACRQNPHCLALESLVLHNPLFVLALDQLAPLISSNYQKSPPLLRGKSNLTVASRQNQSSNSSWGFNFAVTFTPNGAITGLDLGGSTGYGARTYTDTPSTIIANKVLDIYTGKTTFLLGAVLNSKTGQMKLDTDTFVFDNFRDTDQQRNIAAQIGINVNDLSKTTLGGSLYYKNKQGLTFATVGAGTIKVRATPTQNLLTLNRDAANVQRTTVDRTLDIKIPGVNLNTLIADVNNSVNFFRTLAADVPENM